MDGHEGDPDTRPSDPETIALGPEGSTRPVEWDRHQMETDDPGEPDEGAEPGDRAPSAGAVEPKWNKGEMAEDREDHTREPVPDAVEPPGGLSGGGSNPGGGERWADRDREK